ncbi:hypothetical protein, partial [Streptomyces sp. NPDC051129]|uniref:hypothetical protein n=1 Tax=Streptomyces sp. NPDC051129 TaxID=3154639 RepID=UPI003449A17D
MVGLEKTPPGHRPPLPLQKTQLRKRTAAGVLDAISFGKPAMTYEGRGDGGEGEEVFRLALVT